MHSCIFLFAYGLTATHTQNVASMLLESIDDSRPSDEVPLWYVGYLDGCKLCFLTRCSSQFLEGLKQLRSQETSIPQLLAEMHRLRCCLKVSSSVKGSFCGQF